MRYRRQAERMRQAPSSVAQQRTRRERERRQQRFVYVGAGVAGVLLVVFLALGFYFTIYQPPRKAVAQVGPVSIQLQRVETEARLLRGLGIVANPQQVLNVLIRNEILRQRAGLDFAAVVAPGEIEQALAERFEVILEPETEPPTSLTPEGRQRYENFLEDAGVSDQVYRDYVEGKLIMGKIRSYTMVQIQSPQEQVYLRWMVASSEEKAQEFADRLNQGEEFATVVKELDNPPPFADEAGEVGWVPRGAFPELDETIFSAEPNAILGPLSTVYGPVVAQVTQGPEPQTVSDKMRDLLSGGEISSWLQLQISQLLAAYDFGDDQVRWVASRLAEFQPPPRGNGG